MAGIGQVTNNQVGQLGAQTAANVGNNLIGAGNARASGYVGAANALSGGVNTLGTLYGLGAFNGLGGSAGGGFSGLGGNSSSTLGAIGGTGLSPSGSGWWSGGSTIG